MDSTVNGAYKQEKKVRLSAINTTGGVISIANCWERTSSSVRDLRESKRPTDQRGLAKRQHLAGAAKASPLRSKDTHFQNRPPFTLKQAV